MVPEYLAFQTHSSDFPGNFPGINDEWDLDNFKQVPNVQRRVLNRATIFTDSKRGHFGRGRGGGGGGGYHILLVNF